MTTEGAAPVAQAPSRAAGLPSREATESRGRPGASAQALTVEEIWSRVLERATTAATRAVLGSLKLVECAEGSARVLVEDPSQREFAERRAGAIAGMIREIVGAPVRLELQDAPSSGAAASRAPLREHDRAALDHPLVRRAVELFDASVVAVEADATPATPATDDPPPGAAGEEDDDRV